MIWTIDEIMYHMKRKNIFTITFTYKNTIVLYNHNTNEWNAGNFQLTEWVIKTPWSHNHSLCEYHITCPSLSFLHCCTFHTKRSHSEAYSVSEDRKIAQQLLKSWKSNIVNHCRVAFVFRCYIFLVMLVFCFCRELKVLNSASSLQFLVFNEREMWQASRYNM